LSTWGTSSPPYRLGDERCNAMMGPLVWEVEPSTTAVKTPFNINCTSSLAGNLPIQDMNTAVTLKVDSSLPGGNDGDYIGIALGYDQGDLDNPSADYFVLLWSAADGLTLVRVAGNPMSGAAASWLVPPVPSALVTIVGTGPIGSWAHDTSYTLESVFTQGRLRIRINGMTQFDVLASDLSLSQFHAGGLAFFNYSQAAAFYQDVLTTPLTCGD